MSHNLTFITGNAAKAKYLSEHFHLPIPHVKLDLPEIQSLDLNAVVEDKARRAYGIIKSPVLVEDVSLSFTALQSLPGPLIKWFLEALGNDGLCTMLNTHHDRSAVAKVAFAVCDESGVHVFDGAVEGTIAPTPRGETNFGWDPIFIPNGYTKTWAEMTPNEKHETSMRKIALEKLTTFLNETNSS